MKRLTKEQRMICYEYNMICRSRQEAGRKYESFDMFYLGENINRKRKILRSQRLSILSDRQNKRIWNLRLKLIVHKRQ